MQTRLGFIGIGTMGEPMARNLLVSGTRLLIWNRTIAKAKGLEADGAEVASSAAEVFVRSEIIFLMLFDSRAIDEALGRGTPAFSERVRDRTIVQMGTPSPDYSKALESEIGRASCRERV